MAPRGSGTPPDILLISQVFPPTVGGSGELLRNVYARIGGPAIRVLTDVTTAEGVEERDGPLEIRRTPLNGRHWGVLAPGPVSQHVRIARQIRAVCRARPTIVHCGRAQPEAIPALIANRLPPYPKYVFWVHGEDITTALTSRDFTWTMRRVHQRAALAIANSLNSARVLASVGFDPARTRVVYPGVDTDRFHPSNDGRGLRRRFDAPPGRVLLSVGRLQRRKGHDRVLEAMHALEPELPDLRYVIVGDGEERARLEALTRELRLEERVRFEGAVREEQLPLYYAAADIFVLPNRVDGHDFEGFGLVFLEAAASGKPVIGGRSGGVPEAVAEGDTGLLVDASEHQELAAAIRALAGSAELRCRLGGNGRRRAERNFTWQRAADEVLALHDEMAAEPAVPHAGRGAA